MRTRGRIPFFKFSATGNDFILFDNRDRVFTGEERVYFQELCRRRVSVGADGVLLIEEDPKHDFRMRYFNADGRESEMCGNGARSAAYFAREQGIATTRMTFLASEAILEAEVNDCYVRLKMPEPRDFRQNLKLVQEAYLEEGGEVNTGVPHFVLFATNLQGVDVSNLGQKYRHHSHFFPHGTNVDFVEVLSQNEIKVRTYERGVEAETLSCGTGCVAAAFVARAQGRSQFPIRVSTMGGPLRVSQGEASSGFYLEGDVDLVYEGALMAP